MKPLDGVRVLELAHLFPGPYLAHILQGLGAEVAKVEPPGGDRARQMPPLIDETGDGFAFGAVNGGKRSVVLNLKDDDHRAAFMDLVAEANILVNGYRPGVAERLGVDPAACHARNPGLVYVHMTGWGPEGPRADQPGHDIAYQALAGCLAPTGEPVRPPTQSADVLGAVWGACCAVAALRQAEATGEGVVVPVGLSGAALAASTLQRALEFAGFDPHTDPHPLYGGLPGYDLYECADGAWLALGILEPEWWGALCEIVDDEQLYEMGLPSDRDEADTARARLAGHIRSRDRADWLVALREAGIPHAPVVSARDAPDAGAAGGAWMPPFMAEREEAFEAPRLGVDTVRVLESWAGWDPDRSAGFKG